MTLRRNNPAQKKAGHDLTKAVERALARTRDRALAFDLKKAVAAFEQAEEEAKPLQAFDATYAEYLAYLANRNDGNPRYTYSGWLQHVLKTLPDVKAGNLHSEYEAYLRARMCGEPEFTFSGWLRHFGIRCADDNETEILPRLGRVELPKDGYGPRQRGILGGTLRVTGGPGALNLRNTAERL